MTGGTRPRQTEGRGGRRTGDGMEREPYEPLATSACGEKKHEAEDGHLRGGEAQRDSEEEEEEEEEAVRPRSDARGAFDAVSTTR